MLGCVVPLQRRHLPGVRLDQNSPGQTTTVDIGLHPGDHVLSVKARGIEGGCNTGILSAWGGTVRLDTADDVGPAPVKTPCKWSLNGGGNIMRGRYLRFTFESWQGNTPIGPYRMYQPNSTVLLDYGTIICSTGEGDNVGPHDDASVDAVVSLYGRYDWEDRSTSEREWFVDFLETLVVQRSHRHHRDLFRAASPMARIAETAPPFLVVHGSRDSVIPVQQARDFVAALRSGSREVVSYVELAGAQHGFDLHDGRRTGAVCVTVGRFLAAMHARSSGARAASV